MPATVLVGLQWGDEGKGKITDFMAGMANAVVRFQGGANAGHTVEFDNRRFKFHQIPSGILHKGVTGIIANGSVVDPGELLSEMEGIESKGFNLSKLYISDRAHMVMPYHKQLDGAEEMLRGANALGTTKKGIGPCYADKCARLGFRINELQKPHELKQKLEFVCRVKGAYASALSLDVKIDADEIYDALLKFHAVISGHVRDTASMINDMMSRDRKLLFEGAHGIMLDIDHGNYPFVTSSNTVAGNAYSSSGMSPRHRIKTFGVLKAYSTRVGAGPFPTELSDEVGEHLALKGMEVGTTTGRPRRCGWLDLFAVRHAIMVSGASEVALTKLDVLSGIDRLKVAVGYEYEGRKLKDYPSDASVLSSVKPVYREFKGWSDELDEGMDRYSGLPEAAKTYISFIEKFLEVRARIISVGHSRDRTIVRGKFAI